MVCGKMVLNMDKECINGQMEICTKVSLLKENLMGKDFSNGEKEELTKVSF
jgi:hypothetical protein